MSSRLAGILCLFASLVPYNLNGQGLAAADSLAELGQQLNRQAKYAEAERVLNEAMTHYWTHHDTAGWLNAGLEYGSRWSIRPVIKRGWTFIYK